MLYFKTVHTMARLVIWVVNEARNKFSSWNVTIPSNVPFSIQHIITHARMCHTVDPSIRYSWFVDISSFIVRTEFSCVRDHRAKLSITKEILFLSPEILCYSHATQNDIEPPKSHSNKLCRILFGIFFSHFHQISG